MKPVKAWMCELGICDERDAGTYRECKLWHKDKIMCVPMLVVPASDFRKMNAVIRAAREWDLENNVWVKGLADALEKLDAKEVGK